MVERQGNSVIHHPNGQTYLSFSEVAQRCSVSVATVKGWIAKKLLKTHVVLGRQTVGEKDLNAFMEPEELPPGTLLKNAVAGLE